MAYWEQQIRPQRTITDLAQTAIKCHHAFLGELFDCLSGASWDYCVHNVVHLTKVQNDDGNSGIPGENAFCFSLLRPKM